MGTSILSAITIPHSYSITNASYALISDGRVMENAKRLCEWFAESFILRDTQLNRMRAQSGDNLEYGYRKAGLTLSDNRNRPTGTLPIFWHSVKNASFVYDAPYERIHSRHGDQDKEQTESLWKSVLVCSGWQACWRRFDHAYVDVFAGWIFFATDVERATIGCRCSSQF